MNALDLAERALAAAGNGDGALVTVVRERSLTLRFARSRPTQATSVQDLTADIAVLRDGRVGRAGTNATDPERLSATAMAAARAAEAAARAVGTGGYPGFPEPLRARPHRGYDPDTAALEAARGGSALGAAFAAAERAGVEAHGIWSAGAVETAVASTTGTAAFDRVTDAHMKVVCMGPRGRSGYAATTASALSRIDPISVSERAARKAAVRGEPALLPPGEYPVVMEPHAVGELLELLAPCAFNGLAHTEGRGALANRLGTRVAPPSVNLSDSPRYPSTLPRAFDAEAVPKAPLPLIEDGIACHVVHDTRSAAIAGESTTGHARLAGGSPGGPVPAHLVLLGGGAADEGELCAPVERGVYVTRLWYSNVVHAKQTLATAVTRDGTFLIEDGRPTRPLGELRLTDTILGLLARTEELSAQPVLASTGELYGRRFATGAVCPAVRFSSARFTSATG